MQDVLDARINALNDEDERVQVEMGAGDGDRAALPGARRRLVREAGSALIRMRPQAILSALRRVRLKADKMA